MVPSERAATEADRTSCAADVVATGRDDAAADRELVSEARDRAAVARERAAEEREFLEGPGEPQYAAAILQAAEARTGAAQESSPSATR